MEEDVSEERQELSRTLDCLSAVPHGYRLDFNPDKLFCYRIKAAKWFLLPGIALPKILGSLRRLHGKSRQQFWGEISYVKITLNCVTSVSCMRKERESFQVWSV